MLDLKLCMMIPVSCKIIEISFYGCCHPCFYNAVIIEFSFCFRRKEVSMPRLPEEIHAFRPLEQTHENTRKRRWPYQISRWRRWW